MQARAQAVDIAVWKGFLHLTEIGECSVADRSINARLRPPLTWIIDEIIRREEERARYRQLRAFWSGRDPSSWDQITTSDSDSS
jgi:hypothetical protein